MTKADSDSAASEFLRTKRLQPAEPLLRSLLARLHSPADCDAFAAADGVVYKLAGHLSGRSAADALAAGHLLVRLAARCGPAGRAELLRQAGPYWAAHACGGHRLMRRLCLSALVDCCATVALGARLVRLGLPDICLRLLGDADARPLCMLGLARLARLCCLPQSRALRERLQPRLPEVAAALGRLCDESAANLTAGSTDPALCQPFFAVCALHRGFVAAAEASRRRSPELTAADEAAASAAAEVSEERRLLSGLLSQAVGRQLLSGGCLAELSASDVGGALGRAVRCCLARAAFLLASSSSRSAAATSAEADAEAEAVARLVRLLAESAVRHQASPEVGELVAAAAKLVTAATASAAALSTVAGLALLRLGACAPNWLGGRRCHGGEGLAETALALAAGQLRRMPPTDCDDDAGLPAEEVELLSGLITACQACLGAALPAAAASAGGSATSASSAMVPALELLATVKRRLGRAAWCRLAGGNRLLARLLADCAALVGSAAELTAFLTTAADGDGGADVQ